MRKRFVPILLISLILLSSAAIQIPLHNRNAIFNDEGIIFNFAEDILNGEIPFKDIPSYTTPYLFYFLALLYKVFGASLLISRYAMAVVFSMTAVFVFLISRELMEDWLAFVMAIVFVAHRVWAFPVWNMIGYSTFCIFFLAVAVFLLLKFNRKPQLRTVFLVGVVMGIATMFKQDYGGFAGIGILLYFFLWPKLRKNDDGSSPLSFSRMQIFSTYMLGGLMVGLPYFVYLWKVHTLGDFFLNTLLIPLTLESKREATRLLPIWPLFQQDEFLRGNWFQYVPALSFLRLLADKHAGLPHGFIYEKTPLWDMLIKLVHYAPYISILGVAGLLVRRYRKGDRTVLFQNISAVAMVSALLFLTQHRPFDYAHLMQLYLPVFFLLGILIVAFLERLASRKRLHHVICAGLGILLLFYIWQTIMGIGFITKTYSERLEGPRAGFYMRGHSRDALKEAIQYIQDNTLPDEAIFVLPYHSLFYFLSERQNPTRFPILWPVKIFPAMDEEIIEALDTGPVEYLVKFPIVLPGIGSFEEYAPEIAEYVTNNYAIEKKFGTKGKGLRIVILKRKETNELTPIVWTVSTPE